MTAVRDRILQLTFTASFN